MTAIHETAYPRLRSEWPEKLLIELFTPSPEEIDFAKSCTRQPLALLSILIQLKVFQYLGQFISFEPISIPIINHIALCLDIKIDMVSLFKNQPKQLKSRYIKTIRIFMNITAFNTQSKTMLEKIALQTAQTKHHLPDIINILLEELIRLKVELPAFSFLRRLAQHARQKINKNCYQEIYPKLDETMRDQLKSFLYKTDKTTSKWDDLKQDTKKPTPQHIKEFVLRLRELQAWCHILPEINTIPPAKIDHFFLEAQSMDSAMLKLASVEKRYTLMVIYIRQKSATALDDSAEIIIRSVQKLHNLASEALETFKLLQANQVEKLIHQLRQIAMVYVQKNTSKAKLKALDDLLAHNSDQIIEECDVQLAYTDNNYLPFLLKPYQNKRAILFDCLELLSLHSSTRDQDLEAAIKFIKQNRYIRKRQLILPQRHKPNSFSIEWIPKSWLKLIIIPQTNHQDKTICISKHYFEICIFSHLSLELKSGDLFVMGSHYFADYREQLISWKDYKTQITAYTSMVGLENDPKAFINTFSERLKNKAHQVDQKFPENSYVRLENDKLVMRKQEPLTLPEELKQLDQLLNQRLPETNILDILIDTEAWLNLSQDFNPLSGLASRIDHPQLRLIITLFCYGFNFGPSQTIRMIKGFSRRQIAWLNLRYVTEEKLDKAIAKVVNRYNSFMLPKYWGTGKHASADGTKWDIYEQNLLSEFHIRYGGYGGIGYYHVSDTYIALFSHFIPCGVYEALYILDGLLKNESDIQPHYIHGDTHAQSYTVFGLSHLLGIELMPRIRHIKDLNFYKPDTKTVYQYIESLFNKPIRWWLIEKYLPDMLRVALSIKAGKLTPSAILRRLGTKSRKNKLYFAFRELGRAVRTEFLLRYIDDHELRILIHASTCKSEEFNQLLKWTFFGSDGIIAENDRAQQRKIIKYNHLVTNLIILHTMRAMTRALNDLGAEGYIIEPSLLKKLAPYRTQHINRFGSYTLNMDKIIEPLHEERDLKLQINTVKNTSQN